jgi:hypothetical protein
MNSPRAAEAIFNKLCETFKRHGTDDWIDVYRLGQELGFSKQQVQEALAWFETDEHSKVELDHSTTEHVRLGSHGKYLARVKDSSGGLPTVTSPRILHDPCPYIAVRNSYTKQTSGKAAKIFS